MGELAELTQPRTYSRGRPIAEEPRPQVIMTHISACRNLSSRAVAEASWGSADAHIQSTATRRPRPQAVRARGASPLPFRLPARPSPDAPWARGLLSAFWERGSPDFPACGLRRGSKGAGTAHLHQHKTQDPRKGPSLAGRTTQDFLRNGLAKQARKEAERSRQGTSRGAHDASHDDRDQAGARRAPACAVSLFPLWCKGGKHKRGVPRHQAQVSISVQ